MSTTTETLRLSKRLPLSVLLVLAGLMCLTPWPAAAGDLMLHPTRIVLEKNQRASQVELINNGSETVTYRISLVNRRMDEFGQFSDANPPLPGEQFADQMVRFSPRQVVLEPGATQTVRILVRKPAGLAAGEYRSHLLFTQVADHRPAASSTAGAGDGVDIKLTPLIGTSIPVIVRHGQTAANASLSNLRLERGEAGHAPVLAFELNREGNRSLYGDLVVTLAPRGGDEQALTRVNGIAVYTPNTVRKGRLALPPSAIGATGTLHVVFRKRPDDGGAALAQGALELP